MATLISPTDSKIAKIKELTGHALIKSGVTDNGVQRIIERGDDYQKQLIPLLQKLAELVNPFADKIVRPAWDYLERWKMQSWERQLEILQKTYPQLDATGLGDEAKGYLDQADIWSVTFDFCGRKARLFEGLLVFPLPGKAARKLDLGDLWADINKGTEGKGLWGRLCEQVLFEQLAPKFPAFYNYRPGEMGSDRFLPIDEVAQWLQHIEENTAGDFACRPCNFGRRFAGYAVLASRWVAANLVGGVVSPTWINGNGLLTHPERLDRYGVLWMDNGGDRYRLGVVASFAARRSSASAAAGSSSTPAPLTMPVATTVRCFSSGSEALGARRFDSFGPSAPFSFAFVIDIRKIFDTLKLL